MVPGQRFLDTDALLKALFIVEVLAGTLGAINGVGMHMQDVNPANMKSALFVCLPSL